MATPTIDPYSGADDLELDDQPQFDPYVAGGAAWDDPNDHEWAPSLREEDRR